MKNKKIIIITVAIIAALLTGILVFVLVNGKKNDKDISADSGEQVTETISPTEAVTVSPTVTPTTVPTATPTPTPLLTIGDTNPLNIDGYEYFDDNDADNEQGDLYLKARIDYEAKIDNQYLYNIDVYSYEDNVMFSYMTSKVPLTSDEWFEDADVMDTVIGIVLREDGAVKRNIFEKSEPNLLVNNEKFIAIEYDEGDFNWFVYDSELNKEVEMELPHSVNYACSGDGERVYYAHDKRVYMIDADASVKMIEGTDGIWVLGVYSVLYDDEGNEYLYLNIQAEDMVCYYAIVSADTGEILYISNELDSYVEVANNFYIEGIFDNNYQITNWVIGSDGQCYDYKWTGSDNYPVLYSLPGGYLLFTQSTSANEMKLFLYSFETSELIGSTELVISDYVPSYTDMGLYLKRGILQSDMKEMLLQIVDGDGAYRYYIWDLTGEFNEEDVVDIKEHVPGSRPSVDIISEFDFSKYTPSEVSEELLPLREKADDLEDKFGVKICIGEECANIIGGYAIDTLTDYEMVEGALNTLSIELAKYPDGFFKQLNGNTFDGNAFYLAGELVGVGDGMLETASGFQCEYENMQLIVFDARNSFVLHSTVHHEICHSIDDYMQELSWTTGITYLDENEWLELNPPSKANGGIYTYDYDQFGYFENLEYVHDLEYFYTDKIADAYFVDSYSMTFPTEDRARVFESAMSNYLYTVDFEREIHIKAKLDYFAECMRKAFDTTGWEDVPWEIN